VFFFFTHLRLSNTHHHVWLVAQLLSDEQVNREVLQWLSSWKKFVFGGPNEKIDTGNTRSPFAAKEEKGANSIDFNSPRSPPHLATSVDKHLYFYEKCCPFCRP
jgi:hypothetical protein